MRGLEQRAGPRAVADGNHRLSLSELGQRGQSRLRRPPAAEDDRATGLTDTRFHQRRLHPGDVGVEAGEPAGGAAVG